MVCLSHIIFYVKNIQQEISFYKDAFDCELLFIHDSGMYAELSTGETSLAFLNQEWALSNIQGDCYYNNINKPPSACEIVFTTDNVQREFDKALQAGALKVSEPTEKPWGQIVAYVRDPEGILIEIGGIIKK